MTDSSSLVSPIPTLPHPSPSPSPRRGHNPASPRPPRTLTSLLPNISSVHTQPSPIPGEADNCSPSPPPPNSSRTSIVMGFSPVPTHQTLPAVPESLPALSTSPRPAQLALNTSAARRLNTLSPQLTTPVDQVFQWAAPEGSPRAQPSSPRPGAAPTMGGNAANDLLPPSRRNSAAVVSISLSSRSRSRTPRGSMAALPGQRSGNGTPQKGAPAATGPVAAGAGAGTGATATPRGDENHPAQVTDAWAAGVDEMDDWQPAGGMLLESGDDDSALSPSVDRVDSAFGPGAGSEGDDDKYGAAWSGGSDASRVVEDVLTQGMIIGEGLKFQGEVIVPAVSRMALADGSDVGLPLRRGGSEATKVVRGDGRMEKKRYEVVRRLGTGSYAVVYLVKERGGRKEYALKCLSKHDLEDEQLETQLFEAHIHLSLPIHKNIVTLHQTLQTRKWLFLMLELCPGEDLFYWLEKSRDASPQPVHAVLPEEHHGALSSSKLSSSSIPFSSSQMFSNLNGMSFSQSPGAFSHNSHSHNSHSHFGQSPASLLFAHHNGGHHPTHFTSHTPPTPSLLSAFSANTLLSQRRLRLIASMFSQMCEAVAVCHDAGVSHRDIKPENFICCDSVELEAAADGEYGEDGEGLGGEGEEGERVDFGPQAKRKVVVKLTDFGLATTEEESGDVECGSKPYMSYECRNNLGPTYFPAPADVWSLGIVLINMLFHRNPWKDPTPGDPNFDNFLMDPVGFILSKFTGIGREVASYLADHVLCIDVEARVTAREFGRWIKGLGEMIGGRKALGQMKVARLEKQQREREQQLRAAGVPAVYAGEFMKSPVDTAQERGRKYSTSALTSSAPGLGSTPTLSGLPPPSSLSLAEQPEGEREVERRKEPVMVPVKGFAPDHAILQPPLHLQTSPEPGATAPTPPLEHDEMHSATTSATVDEQITPADASGFPSPSGVSSSGDNDPDGEDDAQCERSASKNRGDADSRSLSTHKRRKRGVRKGKAAQAAAAAAAASGDDSLSQASRDALLEELATASQSLAREMSKLHKPSVDVNRIEDFPPLGTTAAQAALEKKSRWKDMMKLSQGNPELAALAKRVKERDENGSLNLSAPAKLQGGVRGAGGLGGLGGGTGRSRHAMTQTHTQVGTVSSGVSSAVSSFGKVSSATSTSAADGEEWRDDKREKERGRDKLSSYGDRHGDDSRARKAAQAAAAITGGMEPMGAFGRPSNLSKAAPTHHGAHTHTRPAPPTSVPSDYTVRTSVPIGGSPLPPKHQPIPASSASTDANPGLSPSSGIAPSFSSADSTSTLKSAKVHVQPASTMSGSAASTSGDGQGQGQLPGHGMSPNKPKLKGQISTLAKMLSGLKTKGKD
ncbi:hypothetical protein IAT38_002517 [Cryptococcus sp. DSM 104549]